MKASLYKPMPTNQPPLPNPHQQPREFLESLLHAAVQRALPLHCMAQFMPEPPSAASGGRVLVVGAGKAAGAMAQAVEALWPVDKVPLLSGLVITRYGHMPDRPLGLPAKARIEIFEAAHPVPDSAGMAASERTLALIAAMQLTANDLVLCLISGGGSALLTLPAEGLTLQDKQRVNQQLLASGASIGEINTLRKHLSRIKGGRLAAACGAARVVTLAISDVPGDDPALIASGPTVADASSCADALAVVQRYGINLPAAVQAALEGGLLESPKPAANAATAPWRAMDSVQLIATPLQSLQAAAAAARQAGMAAYILSDAIEGESREVGKVHAALARMLAQSPQSPQAPESAQFAIAQRPCVLLSGGETTVTLRQALPGSAKPDNKARGRGGRAGEFCLGLAQALQGQPGVYALAADTDGIDGIEANAGAYVAPDTLARSEARGLRIAEHLDGNDAFPFFEQLGDLVITGPTHTNVNDFRALLIL